MRGGFAVGSHDGATEGPPVGSTPDLDLARPMVPQKTDGAVLTALDAFPVGAAMVLAAFPTGSVAAALGRRGWCGTKAVIRCLCAWSRGHGRGHHFGRLSRWCHCGTYTLWGANDLFDDVKDPPPGRPGLSR